MWLCVRVFLAETDALIPTFFSPLYGHEHRTHLDDVHFMLQHMVVLFEFLVYNKKKLCVLFSLQSNYMFLANCLSVVQSKIFLFDFDNVKLEKMQHAWLEVNYSY